MASWFLSSSEDEIRQLLEEKYSENTKRTYKAAQQVFRVSKRFYVEARRKDGSAYTIKIQCIIKQLLDSVFVICKIIKVSVRVISRTFSSTDNSYLDLDNSAYHKNFIQ